ncbi:GNAT family N-acetyltransferase [Nocardioides euryhalodurans]|uniref:GNAT family N-acetyltransferase n=1 Tax=Nocardioides euryhalodurans TaxID=2518370 RepID=A0A4P7GH59_9ACTN|nr:GNAT family N-acetyltransferase [Nocardioides euryhalodurans]QBR91166.1 GNAT family N-acetyltransferase [Nocardioides euryhalodurans]
MALETVAWTPDDVSADDAAQWDRMASARGTQADFYSSHAWFRAWLDGRPRAGRNVVVPAVLEAGRPVAVLPMRRERWTWVSTNKGHVPRFRPALAEEIPDPEVLGLLVDQLGRSGAHDLVLEGLPSRDPATPLLLDAFRDAGYATEVHSRRTDNVVPVSTDEEAFARSQRKLATSYRSRAKRVEPYWDLEVHRYGTGAEPLEQGIDLFEAVSALSWKGARGAQARRTRRSWLERADELGWLRLMMLTLDGRPAAGNIYFRLGDVVFGWSTVYDERMAVLSPGYLLHKHVQESIDRERPALMDLMPGDNPFKQAMDVEQPPLLTVEAHRPTVARRATAPVRRWARHTAQPAVHRAQIGLAKKRNELRRRRTEGAPDRRSRVEPGSGPARGTVAEVETTTVLQRYLAVARSLPSAAAVAELWPEDRWLHVQVADGAALVRLAGSGPEATPPGAVATVLDVVPLEAGTALAQVAEAVADHLGGAVQVVVPAATPEIASEEDLPSLPWTPALVDGPAPQQAR